MSLIFPFFLKKTIQQVLNKFYPSEKERTSAEISVKQRQHHEVFATMFSRDLIRIRGQNPTYFLNEEQQEQISVTEMAYFHCS